VLSKGKGKGEKVRGGGTFDLYHKISEKTAYRFSESIIRAWDLATKD